MTRRGLKAAVTGIALAMAVGLWLPGAAASTIGTIAVGHPVTLAPGGVTEMAFYRANCNMSSSIFAPTQGKDGWVIDLGSSLSHTLSLTSKSAGDAHSLSFMFYNSSCMLMFGVNQYGFPTTRTSYSGSTPAGSRWVVVNGFRGADIELTYTVS
ncbi:MAG: hypothetical protein ABIS18_00730 [Actinomycetota bacterium]